MKKFLFLFTLALIIFAQNSIAQTTLRCIKPGEELLVKPDNDTIWIMNDVRMRKVIETGRKYKLEQEKTAVLTQKCDTLQRISSEKDSLIQTLKEDRGYYETQLSTCRDNVATVGKMAKKYQRRARFATIGCGVSFGLGFALAVILL